ncbi:MAG: hypothetical protein Q7R45_12210 [Sulfuricaulis sp.]|nr:hypothetical protein [Sulfuricaulis sp.]
MNTTKKLICILTAGAALGAAAPVFADSFRGHGYDHNRHSAQYRDYGRHGFRDHDRRVYRDYNRHNVVVVQRPYIVQQPYIIEQPVYYSQPAPAANIGMGALIGAAIGGIIDSQQ